MSANKRYYWLKLEENFFEDDTIAWLEEQENGKDYVIFYLKLALKSLKDDGRLIRYVGETLIPYDVKALAKLTNTSPDTVAVSMKTFLEIGLISQLESGEIYLNQIEEMVGSETDVAKRVRKHRAKKALGEGNNKQLLQSNADETKSNTELEKEKEKELEVRGKKKEVNKDHSPAKAEQIPYKVIIDYLNKRADRNFNHKASSNQDLIKARWNEGYTLDDFKQAIDNKVAHANDPNHFFTEEYLRPSTLFRKSNFDEYVNAVVKSKKTKASSDDNVNFDELSELLGEANE